MHKFFFQKFLNFKRIHLSSLEVNLPAVSKVNVFIIMSENTEKTREQILAERQEKKKKKAALKNQPKGKNQNPPSSKGDGSLQKETNLEKNSVSSKGDVHSLTSKSDQVQSCTRTPTNLESQGKVSELQLKEKLIESTKVLQKNENIASPKEKSSAKNLDEKPSISQLKKEKVEEKKLNKTSEKDANIGKENFEGSAVKDEPEGTKTKAQLRAERRAKQEAERARKLAKSQGVPQEKKVTTTTTTTTPAKVSEPSKTVKPSSGSVEVSHRVKLFAHLYDIAPDTDTVQNISEIHPSIIQLGTRYSSKVVSGANACCLALLNAFKKVVMDFETPQNQEFSRGLEAEVTKCMAYLSKCRPVAVSMVNAVKHLKFQISQNKGNELECKNNICDWIDVYIKEQLEMASKAICLFVTEKITSGDVILTYGCSSLIQQILISVHKEGIKFQVVVVDGRPWLEGREMLRRLVSAGISCTYVFVNGLSFIMPEVTKILLGAHALLANGYVMSRAGSSQIALLAKAYNVPVLVCCETHKFSERVQTDSFVYNALGNPDDLVSNKGCISQELSKWKSIPHLTPLNLTYDVTPPDLVTAVVTEIAVLPCTSVPVILRIKPPDISG